MDNNNKKLYISLGVIFVSLLSLTIINRFQPKTLETYQQEPSLESTSEIQAKTRSGNQPQIKKALIKEKYYTDRNYILRSLPSELDQSSLISLANDDKKFSSDVYLTINTQNQSNIFVAYDSRAKSLPNWLKEFNKTDFKINVSDRGAKYLNIYRKTYPAGKIILGGNLAKGARGSNTNYIVFVKITKNDYPNNSYEDIKNNKYITENSYKLNITGERKTNPLICQKGELNCYYRFIYTPVNKTGKILYNSKIWVTGNEQYPNLITFISNNGKTENNSYIVYKNRVLPDEAAISTSVTVKPPVDKVGKYYATINIDGQTCNQTTNDCVFYGGSSYTIMIEVIDNLNTPVPTTTSCISQEGGKCGGTVAPEYQCQCAEGLYCDYSQIPENIAGAFGTCRKDTRVYIPEFPDPSINQACNRLYEAFCKIFNGGNVCKDIKTICQNKL